MSDSLKVDYEQLKRTAAALKQDVEQAHSALSVDEQLEVARQAHGPIFARTKEALGVVLAARRADLEDQIAFGTEKADEITRWVNNFEGGEYGRGQRQGSVGL